MIYLDNSAGTRPYPEVITTVTDILTNHWGNASSDNSMGYDAKDIIDNVIQQVANDINCKPEEIIWTSGACEANSLAINGFRRTSPFSKFYTTNLEHASIHKMWADSVMYIENDGYGFVDKDDLSNLIAYDYRPLVSACFANSEIGTIQDIKSISKIVHQVNGVLHVDATQLYPWQPIDVQELGIDMMSVSGQKLHSVKGIGFLYVKDTISIQPIIYGSQQEGRRGGTYPTHLIAAFGKALEITRRRDASMYVKIFRNTLLNELLKIPGVTLNGPSVDGSRLVNNINLTIDGVSAEDVVTLCDERGIIIAKGSACQSYIPTPSKTLLAIGLTEQQALSTIRITLDEFNTIPEMKKAAGEIKEVIEILRKY